MRKTAIYYVAILFSCFVGYFPENTEPKLLLVQILWRHGDRAPIKPYPDDPNPNEIWKEGFGMLTQLGRKQHYALGKFFRKMYRGFSTWGPNEVKVLSSEVDRCIKSAQANLASFFAPTSEWQFEQELQWQPITVNYLPEDQDKFLQPYKNCPKLSEELKRTLNSSALMSEHQKLFDSLRSRGIKNAFESFFLYDTLSIEKKYNLKIPSWVESIWDELKNISILQFNRFFSQVSLQRLQAGNLIEKIIDLMKRKLVGDIPSLKFQIYSAHDLNVAAVLNALNIYNNVLPPLCSSVIFELYEMTDGDQAVRLLYQNSSSPEAEIQDPHLLVLEGCTELCPFDYFINYTKKLIPEDWETECQL